MVERLRIPYLVDNGAFAPDRAHEADAGFDLKTPVSFHLAPGSEVEIDLGVHMGIPKGYVGFLKSKSGLNVRYGITSEGVIDSGYTGSIVAKLRRDASQENDLMFEVGDKVTQIVILPIPDVEMFQADSLEEAERGDNGFGSTGR